MSKNLRSGGVDGLDVLLMQKMLLRDYHVAAFYELSGCTEKPSALVLTVFGVAVAGRSGLTGDIVVEVEPVQLTIPCEASTNVYAYVYRALWELQIACAERFGDDPRPMA